MGSILPHAINTGGSAPVSTTSQQPRIGPFGIGDLLQTAGDVMVQLGGSNEAVARLAARRVQEQQQDIERQRYAASLQQQRFMNSLASHRDRLADQEYQLRRAALTNRTGGGGSGDFAFTEGSQGQSPTSSMLSQIQGSSAVPIPTPVPNDPVPGAPVVPPVTNEHAPQIPAAKVVAVNNKYVEPPIIDPANFAPEMRANFDRLKATNPAAYFNVMKVANYDALLDDVLKGIKNPRDRMGFSKAVLAANPNYSPASAASWDQYKKDLKNPKTRWGRLDTVTDLLGKADELEAAYKNLHAGGPGFWQKDIVVPLKKLVNSTPFTQLDAKRGVFAREYERTLTGGKPTQASINQATGSLPDGIGFEGARRVLNGYRDPLLGEWVAALNHAQETTNGGKFMPVEYVPQSVIARLVDGGYAIVKNGHVIPRITDAQYEQTHLIGEK